jgi:DNA-binding Xre family transcriptional regulator
MNVSHGEEFQLVLGRYAGERLLYRLSKTGAFLPKEELTAVLRSPQRRDRFLGGMVDQDAQIVTLWRGDVTPCVVPFSVFTPSASGNHPDWSRFKVTDYGNAIQFGDYKAAADAVLYECDADFRRRMHKARLASEQTLGASIRRLRKQRRLTRNDFHGLDPKTLARIERGEVAKPQSDTLALIAKRLDVSPEELGEY